ncbi:MAG: ABC transporter ATP-binding protein [Cytophagaceae bacterium]|nr:ABC transporter ATP-binding protein [Cytophagaceae bacterium]
MQPLLRVCSLSKSYQNQPVLHDISFSLNAGEVLALVGESGAGKSTLLHLLAGLTEADSGEIFLDETDVTAFARRLVPGYPAVKLVAQDYRLFPNVSLRANICYALREYSREYQAFRVDQLLELTDLLLVADRLPRQVSGGEQQRAAIARALAERPRLLLLDEPFSHLDALHKQTLRQNILALVHTEGIGCIIVTHDLLDALTTAETIGVLRKGRLLQLTTPSQLLLSPADAYVKALVESGLAVVSAVRALQRG